MYSYFTDAEKRFNEAGGMFHLSTKPIEDEVVFASESDYITVNNLIALAISTSKCILLAFAIMSNHLHFILEGSESDCLLFFEDLKYRLQRVFARLGRGGIIPRMKPGLVPINDLKQFRDELAYVIRNPFVVRFDVNPFNYRWCSGFLYFNPLLSIEGVPASKLKGRELRSFVHTREETTVPDNVLVKDGVANPASFVDYIRAESFFDHARQFVMWILKNVEGQVETASRHGELPHLNDDEMLRLSLAICKKQFKVAGPKMLPEDDKRLLAVKLKNDYSASNGQIARCANLSPQVVNTLFPLSTSQKQR